MAVNEHICPECKKTSPVEAQFCQHCGHKFSINSNTGSGLNHWHIIYTVIIVFMAEMIFTYAAMFGWYINFPETVDNLSTLGKVGDAGAFTGVFSGSLFAAYRFAEKSKKEVLAGAVAAVLISKITVITVIDAPGLQFITGTLLVLITAFAGIMTGVLILKKRGRL